MSEMHGEEKKNNQQENVTKKNGLKICGYVIPWWVVVVVVLVLLYILYEYGYFESIIGKPGQATVVRLPESSVLPQANSNVNILAEPGLETPEQVRALFGRPRRW